MSEEKESLSQVRSRVLLKKVLLKGNFVKKKRKKIQKIKDISRSNNKRKSNTNSNKQEQKLILYIVNITNYSSLCCIFNQLCIKNFKIALLFVRFE